MIQLPSPPLDVQTLAIIGSVVTVLLSLLKAGVLERWLPWFSPAAANQARHDALLMLLNGVLLALAIVGCSLAGGAFTWPQLPMDIVYAAGLWGVNTTGYNVLTKLRSPNPGTSSASSTETTPTSATPASVPSAAATTASGN